MSIPATLSADIANLASAVTAAYPLAQAPAATLTALRLQALGIVNEIEAAVVADDALVADPVYTDVASYVAALIVLQPIIVEQSGLVDAAGLAGRVELNLTQVGA